MRTFPDDFDEEDCAFASVLVPEGAFLTSMMTVVAWMDADGSEYWRCYNATSSSRLAHDLGLLEYAKLDMISRCDTGLPIRYRDDDDE